MAGFEFWARISLDDTLRIPSEVAAQLPRERPVRVILLVPDASPDQEWARLTADEFLKGYADSDAIYDEVPAG